MNSREQARMARQHIFAVNDAPDFLEILRELLQGEHYNVTTTNVVPNTFAQIAALDPALLIVDLAVGESSGVDLLARIADEAKTQQIPVIVVSTSQQLLDEFQARSQRFAEYRILRKPLDLDELLGMIEELVGPA